MKAEVSLEQRVRVHSALADPARLRIVDHLSLGDASPSELRALVDMPSNLLAHHLRVLERAGVVERRRSEADRRRTYLCLVPEQLDGLIPGRRTAVTRIVFVCTANSARSQLAAALWGRTSPVPATSAGTHPAPKISARAVTAARRRGLGLSAAQPRKLSEVLSGDDLIVTVCDNAHEELGVGVASSPTQLGALHWSVPDPVSADTDAAFDAVLDDLDHRITRLAPRLVPAT
jgi:protein-tyrosine-phosphatase/DNA-binding transcriptional ArsR family regulator